MTGAQRQPAFWAVTVSTAKESVDLYFDPLRRLTAWLRGRSRDQADVVKEQQNQVFAKLPRGLLLRALLHRHEQTLTQAGDQWMAYLRLVLTLSQDKTKVDELENKQMRLALDWIRWAVEFKVATDYAPHVVEQHEYRAAWWRLATIGQFVTGLAVAVYLAAAGMVSAFWGALGGLIGFTMAAIFACIAIRALNRKCSVPTSPWVWAWALFIFSGVFGIVAARLPRSGQFLAIHQELLTVSWLALELGLLWGTAMCYAAAYCYGWSKRITAQYMVVKEEIRSLRLRIDKNNPRIDLLEQALGGATRLERPTPAAPSNKS